MRHITCASLLLLLAGCAGEPRLDYPAVARGDHSDPYHGVEVPDPYRWLEDLESPATSAFVEAQNGFSRPRIEALPARQAIVDRLTALWSYERFGLPEKRAGRYVYRRNDGLQDQDVLFVADALDAEPRVLIDPNTFSEDGTVALSAFELSHDGERIAYSISDGGTDWKSWRVRDVASGVDLEDTIRFTKFGGISWSLDDRGFYYSRYPLGANGEADGSRPVSIYFHTLGTPQEEDRLVFRIDDHPRRNPYGTVTDDGRYLVIDVFDGYEANGVYLLDLAAPDSEVVHLLDDWDARYDFLGKIGPRLYFLTTLEASNGRIVAIDPERPDRADWIEVVAEADDVLDDASLVGGRVIAEYLVDVKSQVEIFTLDGQRERTVELPGLGSVGGFGGVADDPETFYQLATYTAPPSLYSYDVATGESELFRRPESPFSPEAYTTEQIFYESRDGTRVPMFLTRRYDVERDGSNATLLYGYGGFNISLTPRFSPEIAVWLEMGGIVAVPNLRGGGEYGEAWHLAGTKERKQNVFADFIAAADWLIAQGFTSPGKLAVYGRSNGGLLIAAVLTQRPELFGATLPAVGVLDMLRYHTASANAYQWGSDFGWSDDPAHFPALHAYSPLHNVEPGRCYPPTLITTADHDDRVVPWHSYKFAAELQRAQGCAHPILLRVETRAGHGAGKPTWMRIEDLADQWAFAAHHLGMAVAL